jgi:hypothetical protein
MIIETTIIDIRAHRTHLALHFATMSAVISDAMQIIEVIQAVRLLFLLVQTLKMASTPGLYSPDKGLGKTVLLYALIPGMSINVRLIV